MVLEDVVRGLMSDPPWKSVFGHTLDVVWDSVTSLLAAVATMTLTVKLVSNIASGDLACIFLGSTNTTLGESVPYATPIGLMDYINQDRNCIGIVYTLFMERMPFVLLFETLLLILEEKLVFRLPIIAKRVERFYHIVVEHLLVGSDPDAADDLADPKTSTAAVSRLRQRKEVCRSLMKSDVIYRLYVGKNFAKMITSLAFFVINGAYGEFSDPNQTFKCLAPVQAFEGLYEGVGDLYFQCKPRNYHFMTLLLKSYTSLLLVHFVIALASAIWCWKFRPVANLINTIEKVRKEEEEKMEANNSVEMPVYDAKSVKKSTNIWKRRNDNANPHNPTRIKAKRDFLFLFDLLAHNCGLESTLRVLSHADDSFFALCMPLSMDEPQTCLRLEERQLKLKWRPAHIETCMQHSTLKRVYSNIQVDSYEITMFPPEAIEPTRTVRSTVCKDKENSTMQKSNYDNTAFVNAGNREVVDTQLRGVHVQRSSSHETNSGSNSGSQQPTYSTWFSDLNGGLTQYVLTVSCLIGKSRMRGAKIVTHLVPYGPVKPPQGIVSAVYEDRADLEWQPPAGDSNSFTKYALQVEKVGVQQQPSPVTDAIDRHVSFDPDESMYSSPELLTDRHNGSRSGMLNPKLTSFTVTGLQPGQLYSVRLATKTGSVSTRTPISDQLLTLPRKVLAIHVENVSCTEATINWVLDDLPSPHLKGFQVSMSLLHSDDDRPEVETVGDQRLMKNVSVSRLVRDHTFTDLMPGSELVASVFPICSHAGLVAKGSTATVALATKPLGVQNLQLDSRGMEWLCVSWDPPAVMSALPKYYKYVLTLVPTSGEGDVRRTVEVSSERNAFTFKGLMTKGGCEYCVSVLVSLVTPGSGLVVESQPKSNIFLTLPPAPEKLLVTHNKLGWLRSPIQSIVGYKLHLVPVANHNMDDEDNELQELDVCLANDTKETTSPSDANEGNKIFWFDFPIHLVAKIDVVYEVTLIAVAKGQMEQTESAPLHDWLLVRKDGRLKLVHSERGSTIGER